MASVFGVCVPGIENFAVTRHATERIGSRRLQEGAAVALAFGRVVRTRAAEVFVVGRKEIEFAAREGIDLAGYEGIQVVCGIDGQVITAYRNKDLRRLKPRHRGRRWVF